MAQEIADSTLLNTWSSSGNITEPDISKIIEGWQLGEQPPHEYMNWLQNTFGSKLNHIFKNGVAKWEEEKEYLAGSSVQHSGNVWLCKTTNTNSEPTDVNANWKRFITVEALTAVLNGYVATTGDQDIDGIKNFLKSPIVPTPTTGEEAVNKDYVDSVAVVPDASTTVKGIVELATDAEIRTGTDNTKAITPLGYNQTTLGWGQTWQDVTASRVVGTTYTNTSGKPIFVQIYCLMAVANVNWGITVDGARRSGQRTEVWPGNSRNTVQAIIPNGSTYSVSATTGSITLDTWNELR